MSQPRQFEGHDVRVLLDEIRGAYGSDPVISRAETFRTGGVLGFFQREKFRLVVEGEPAGPARLPATTPPTAAQAPLVNATPADSTLALAAYAAVAGRNAATTGFTAAAAPVSALTLPAAGRFRYDGDDDALAADLFALLADETEDSFEAAAPAAAQPALEAPEAADLSSFESVLRRVSSLVEAPPALSAAATGFPDAQPAPGYSPVSWPTVEGPVEPAAAAPWAAPPVTASATFTADPVVTPAVAEVPGPPADEDRAGPATEGEANLRLALYRAGFGPGMAAAIEQASAERGINQALIEVFEGLPEPPGLPRRNGSLVVVAGPGPRAAAEASRIAGEVGADPGGVAFASQRPSRWPVPEDLRIRTAEDAMELAPGHRRGRIGVVAVDAPVGSASSAWARHVIHALRPTLVVGVVDAMYKNEDIDCWVRDLDGVDTLIVDNADSTTSPARVLDLELPVTRVGDQAASPARWAATVLDRIPTEAAGEG